MKIAIILSSILCCLLVALAASIAYSLGVSHGFESQIKENAARAMQYDYAILSQLRAGATETAKRSLESLLYAHTRQYEALAPEAAMQNKSPSYEYAKRVCEEIEKNNPEFAASAKR